MRKVVKIQIGDITNLCRVRELSAHHQYGISNYISHVALQFPGPFLSQPFVWLTKSEAYKGAQNLMTTAFWVR